MYKQIIPLFLLVVSNAFGQIEFNKRVLDGHSIGSFYSWSGDLDNDGDIDAVGSAYDSAELAWYENDGSQNFTKHVISADLESSNVLYVFDFDNDDDLDIMVYQHDAFYFYYNDGAQNFSRKTMLEALGAEHSFITYGDFNGDSYDDIISWPSDSITWYDSSGPTPFVSNTTIGYSGLAYYISADLDNDRDLDFIARDTVSQQVYVLQNNAGQTMTQIPINFELDSISVGVPVNTRSKITTDIDRDGDLDIVAYSSFNNVGKVYWFENDGNFSYTKHTLDTNGGLKWFITTDDINGDGFNDIIVTDYENDKVIWYENNSTQNFTKHVIDQVFDDPLGISLNDLDNDGDKDIVVNSYFDDTLFWLENMQTSKNIGDHAYQSPNLGNYNYIYTITPQKAMTTIDGIKINSDVIENVQYVDGLGRPNQTVALRAGGKGEDLITKIEYDAFGRQTKEYLPFSESSNTGTKFRENIDLNGFYKNSYAADFANTLEEEINPYSEMHYEYSPLNRVQEQSAPGDSWKLEKSLDTDHTIKFDYQTNIANEVRFFEVTFSGNPLNTESPSLTETGYYGLAELYKTITKDENWQPGQEHDKDHTAEEFKDKQNRIVLKRSYNLNQAHDTYYVYDDFGNLTYVIPPKAADSLSIDQPILDDLCYQYKYDSRNRLIEKKLPGKGLESIVYDRLDRPVLTQDANLKAQGVWLFTKYDALGRVIYTGKFTDSGDRLALQAFFDTKQNAADNYEERDTGTLGIDYSSADFPNTNLEVLTVDYYDDYTFSGAPFDPISNPETVFDAQTTTLTKGLATGSKVKVLDNTNDWVTTVTYYDDKARPIYEYSNNSYLTTTDIVKTDLDFTGRALKVRTEHTYSSEPELVTLDTFTYDQASRVLKQVQCIGGSTLEDDCGDEGADGIEDTLVTTETVNPGVSTVVEATNTIELDPGFEASPIPGQTVEIQITQGMISGSQTELIAENLYDELGQLVTKKVGNVESVPLQTVNYSYNVRGWLKTINDINATDKLFNFSINYDSGATPLFNGNISRTQWSTLSVNPNPPNNPISTEYTYSYDALNRITSAIDNTGNYNLTLVGYDKNGNIENLQRQGHIDSGAASYGVMDDLNYVYDSGNKLLSVTEQTTGNATYGFKDGNTAVDDYDYDTNGNLTQDLNKGIGTNGISYNHLNLPDEIDFGGGDKIEYVYDASGIKVQKKVTEGSSVTTTNYAGNYIYENNNLQFFNQPEGYVTPGTNNDYNYVYQYKDHLGNIRLSYADGDNDGHIDIEAVGQDLDNDGVLQENEIIEENNYYPFGLKHKGYNTVVNSGGNSVAERFKHFQGQERTEDLGLNVDNWRYRTSDPAIGRFWQIDPLSEDYMDWGPYVFSGNRVIDAVELEGLEPWRINYHSTGERKEASDKFIRENPELATAIGLAFVAPALVLVTPEAAAGFVVNEVKDEVLSQATGGVSDVIDISKGVKNLAQTGFEKITKNSDDLLNGGNRVSDDLISAPPNKAGDAPIGNDGHPIELHHRDQTPDGPIDELTRTDHRLGDNFKKNHANTGSSASRIDRKAFKKLRAEHWKKEFARGRFDNIKPVKLRPINKIKKTK